MEDFQGSVAQQDVTATTEVSTTAVVGENFYKVAYVIANSALSSSITVPQLVTKDTYASFVEGLTVLSVTEISAIEDELESLFSYFEGDVYIMSPALFLKNNLKAYWVYLHVPEFVKSTTTVGGGTSTNTSVTTWDFTTMSSDAVAITSGTGTVAATSGDGGSLTVTANSGKLQTRGSDAQFNSDATISVPLGSAEEGSTIVLSFYPNYHGATIGGDTISSDTYTYAITSSDVSAGSVTLAATETCYLYSITLNSQVTTTIPGEEVSTIAINDSAASAFATGTLSSLDARYNQAIMDLAFDWDDSDMQSLVKQYISDLTGNGYVGLLFARPATIDGSSYIGAGYSPALYQLGRTLGYMNSTGTPVGNSIDMVACAQANVLPNGQTGSSIEGVDADMASFFDEVNLSYFKPIGNSTGQVACYGGWTINGSASVANWIVAYINYRTRVACAEVITQMNSFKNELTYNKCLAQMTSFVQMFVDINRVYDFVITAPAYSELPKSNGHTLNVPDAWEAYFADNVRKVAISGTLYVAA